MADKVAAARDAMAEIDQQANQIKETIKLLIETDPRMKTDETYRNRVIGERLREVQKLQEKSQIHQRVILQNPDTSTRATAAASSVRTRSRATTSTITTVAANIQQVSKQAMMATRSSVSGGTPPGSAAIRPVSEAEQKRSVTGLYSSLKWLVDTENDLRCRLEKDGLDAGMRVSESAHEDYALIKSLRILAESLCSELRSNPRNESAVTKLREVIKYVESRNSN